MHNWQRRLKNIITIQINEQTEYHKRGMLYTYFLLNSFWLILRPLRVPGHMSKVITIHGHPLIVSLVPAFEVDQHGAVFKVDIVYSCRVPAKQHHLATQYVFGSNHKSIDKLTYVSMLCHSMGSMQLQN